MLNELQKVREILEFLIKFEIVGGDAIKRTSPHSNINLNSTEHWLVSPSKAAHELRQYLVDVQQVIVDLDEYIKSLEEEQENDK